MRDGELFDQTVKQREDLADVLGGLMPLVTLDVNNVRR